MLRDREYQKGDAKVWVDAHPQYLEVVCYGQDDLANDLKKRLSDAHGASVIRSSETRESVSGPETKIKLHFPFSEKQRNPDDPDYLVPPRSDFFHSLSHMKQENAKRAWYAAKDVALDKIESIITEHEFNRIQRDTARRR